MSSAEGSHPIFMEKLLQKQIKTFMTKEVIAVKAGESIKNVFKLMEKHGIVGLPVVNQDQGVIGILTESDLIKHFTTLNTPVGVTLLGSVVYLDNLDDWSKNLKQHTAELAGDIMNPEVVTLVETQTLAEAIDLMADRGVNRLPVVSETGKLSGIITRKDIVHQLAQLKTL